MEVSNTHVSVANSRRKCLYFSVHVIVIIVSIAIITSGILIYDKIQSQTQPTEEANRFGTKQTRATFSSNITKRLITTGILTTESAIPPTLSGVNGTFVLFDTPNSTNSPQTEIMSSYTSAPLTPGAQFLTTVQTYGSLVSLEIPVSTSTELTTAETEVPPSRTSVPLSTDIIFTTPLTSNVTTTTPVQTYFMTSTVDITTNITTTCQPSLPDTIATQGYAIDCSEFDIAVGLSAIQRIYPYGSTIKTSLTNCLSTSDGIWTIVQRRFDGSVDFFRIWNEYKDGFGDVSGEYWLGNDALHEITKRSSYTLKIVLKDWDNVTKYAMYDVFNISDECDDYRLTIGGYKGDAGDSLSSHNGHKFSTLDRDHDSYPDRSCAEDNKGGYWYFHCGHSNLNGPYFNQPSYKGIFWYQFNKDWLSIKEATMMIQKA